MDNKRCSRCKAVKPCTSFGKSLPYKDGLAAWCKTCHADYSRAHRPQHPPQPRKPRERKPRQPKKRHVMNEAQKEAYRTYHRDYYRKRVMIYRARIKCAAIYLLTGVVTTPEALLQNHQAIYAGLTWQ